MQQPKGRSGMCPKCLFPSALLMLHQSYQLCVMIASMGKNIWGVLVSSYTGRVVCYWKEKCLLMDTNSLNQKYPPGKRAHRNKPTMVKVCEALQFILFTGR